MFDSARAAVLAELTLPEDWHVVDEQRLPSTIDRETVIVKHDEVEKLPGAPIGSLLHTLVLAVFIPNKDLAKAEARLDESVTEVLMQIDGHRSINWSKARKVIHPNNLWPGWEIDLTIITAKPDAEQPPAPDTEE